MEDMRNAYKILIGKPEGKRPLARPRCRWEDYIRVGHTEIGWKGVDWMHMPYNRDQWWALTNTAMKFQVP
jgi:hypothetical protein